MPYRWVVLFFGVLAYATSQFARQNYSGVQKFIAADLHLDKASLGLLGSVFFYSYALFQMPWGVASDRFGSRWVAGLAILLTAGAMVGFATGQTERELLFWRAMSGIAGAAAYVSMSGAVARWFPPSERGLSQAVLGGAGGSLGECIAFFLLPVISVYFSSGWRQGTNMIAGVIAGMGVLCLVFLRSAPPHERPTSRATFDWRLLRDPRLWCYALLFTAFIVSIRIVQPWIPVYVADAYIARNGMSVNAAVIGGGILAIVAFSLLGRGVGCPLAGKLSDILLERGVSRAVVAVGWLTTTVVFLLLLSTGPTSILAVGAICCVLGLSVNLFTIIAAAVSETYSPAQTASIVSFLQTIAQLVGATALAGSGYIGMSLSSQAGNALAEYRGIWLSGTLWVTVLAVPGLLLHVGIRKGWLQTPASGIGSGRISVSATGGKN